MVRRRLGAFLRLDAYHSHGILRGLARFAREHPGLEIVKLPQPGRFSTAALRALALDAVVARVTSEEDERTLRRSGLPAVNLSGQFATPHLAWVNTDDAQVAALAGRHLWEHGYRHFAYCGNRTHLASLRRLRGLRAFARTQNATCHEKALPRRNEARPFPLAVRRELAAWLVTLPRPVGVLGFNDRVALELAEACAIAGLRIPHDVAVVGVGNDLTRLEFAPVGISSVELPTQQLGYEAARLALQQLHARRREPAEILLPPPQIVIRQSTDHFAVPDPVVAAAMAHIRLHRGNTIYVAEIARTAGVSRRVLEKRFRRTLGTSVYAAVQQAHLERARELMADPALTLAEIAYASGYENPRHLSLAFRRLLGNPPGDFRRRMVLRLP